MGGCLKALGIGGGAAAALIALLALAGYGNRGGPVGDTRNDPGGSSPTPRASRMAYASAPGLPPVEVAAGAQLGVGIGDDEVVFVAHTVRRAGYRCDAVDGLYRHNFSVGFKAYCNGRYVFDVEDRGGRWVVTVR